MDNLTTTYPYNYVAGRGYIVGKSDNFTFYRYDVTSSFYYQPSAGYFREVYTASLKLPTGFSSNINNFRIQGISILVGIYLVGEQNTQIYSVPLIQDIVYYSEFNEFYAVQTNETVNVYSSILVNDKAYVTTCMVVEHYTYEN